MFSQVHYAGDLAASDFTDMSSLGITIAGQRFEHLAYHFVLTYSDWEAVTLCTSESFEALSDGLQNAFWELGGVPRRHRSDSLSAAVNNLSAKREFRARYEDLLKHCEVRGERINVRQPHENGDSESSHGHFKTAVDQALQLRGSRDFASRDDYQTFLRQLLDRRNAARRERHGEELALLRPLPAERLESRLCLPVTVDRGSLIHIHRNVYSVQQQASPARRRNLEYWGTLLKHWPERLGAPPAPSDSAELVIPLDTDGSVSVRLWQYRRERKAVAYVRFDGRLARRAYGRLHEIAKEIDDQIEGDLIWDWPVRSSLAVCEEEVDFADRNDWEIQHVWFIEELSDIVEAVTPELSQVKGTQDAEEDQEDEDAATAERHRLRHQFWTELLRYVSGSKVGAVKSAESERPA